MKVRKPKPPFNKIVKAIAENAIRQAWCRSAEYESIFNTCILSKGQYQCAHCKKIWTNKSKLYLEHLIFVKFFNIKTLEEFITLVEDKNNIQVWGICCKLKKDKLDKKIAAALKKCGKSFQERMECMKRVLSEDSEVSPELLQELTERLKHFKEEI